MAKLYLTKTNPQKMVPKKETVHFLLNYSKALKILKTGSLNIELISN